jgi:hypothetical protein
MKIRGQSGEILEIKILHRSQEEDPNWLNALIEITVPSFKTLYNTNIYTTDLQFFYQDIQKMQSGATNMLDFSTTEEGLSLHIEQKKTGTLNIFGKTDPSMPNILQFSFLADNIELDNISHQLEKILKEYPNLNPL